MICGELVIETENIVAVEEEKPQYVEFISKKQARELFGVSVVVFDRWKNETSYGYCPDFPKKIYMGKRVFYVRSEIRAYMQKLMDKKE